MLIVFSGHLFPGIIVIIFGTWWAINVFHRQFMASLQQKNPKKFVSRVWYPDPFCRCFPIEIICKLSTFAGGLISEMIHTKGQPQLHNIHHITMHTFLAMSGIMDLMTHWKLPLPKNTDTFGVMLFCGVMTILLASHTDKTDSLDMIVHQYSIYLMMALFVLIGIEACFRDQPIIALTKSYIIMLFGTWFSHIGFITGSPFPGETFHWGYLNEHKKSMLAAVLISWHGAVNLLFLASIGICVWFWHKWNLNTKQVRLNFVTNNEKIEFMRDSEYLLAIECT